MPTDFRTDSVELAPYPGVPAGPVRRIVARLAQSSVATLAVSYVLEGDIAQLRVPPPGSRRLGTNLWQHMCFEIFVARKAMPAYHEFNFSPSREWAAYAFSGYRDGAPLNDPQLDPLIDARCTADALQLGAVIRLDRLSLAGAVLAIGLSAVVEDAQGALTYWALRHPAAKPDFHHRGGFVLELDAPRA